MSALQSLATHSGFQLRISGFEPRFAQLKQRDGFRRWTVWGLDGVRTPWPLLGATLNLRILFQRWQSKVQGGLARAQAVLGELQVGIWALPLRLGPPINCESLRWVKIFRFHHKGLQEQKF